MPPCPTGSVEPAQPPRRSGPKRAVRVELEANYIGAWQPFSAAVVSDTLAILIYVDAAARTNPQPALPGNCQRAYVAACNFAWREDSARRSISKLEQSSLCGNPQAIANGC